MGNSESGVQLSDGNIKMIKPRTVCGGALSSAQKAGVSVKSSRREGPEQSLEGSIGIHQM